MTSDMESLSRAEEELQHLMSKLQQKDSKIESNKAALQQQQQLDSTDVMEVSRLREQDEVLRIELQQAEIELEDRCWIACRSYNIGFKSHTSWKHRCTMRRKKLPKTSLRWRRICVKS